MNHFRQGWRGLAAFVVALILVSPAIAQTTTNQVPHFYPLSVPPSIMPPSPVDYFRKLLAMSPEDREAALAGKPPEIRERIMAKVNEYEALDPDERELRLLATELRWYMIPLLRNPPDLRFNDLTYIPDSIRSLVKARVMQWELLPPPMQQEFLDNEHTLGYFSSVDVTNQDAGETAPTDVEQSRWNALSEAQHKAMSAQFNQFFNLSAVEKDQALDGLSSDDRAQMQRVIQTFDKLPPPLRVRCLLAFTRYANMSPQQRAEFLKNAHRWSQMTDAQRKALSDLVAHVPQWPPVLMPPAMLMPPNFHPAAITNHG